MISDTELKSRGFEILSQALGLVEAARFVCLLQRERFDYTRWRNCHFNAIDAETQANQASAHWQNKFPLPKQ